MDLNVSLYPVKKTTILENEVLQKSKNLFSQFNTFLTKINLRRIFWTQNNYLEFLKTCNFCRSHDNFGEIYEKDSRVLTQMWQSTVKLRVLTRLV